MQVRCFNVIVAIDVHAMMSIWALGYRMFNNYAEDPLELTGSKCDESPKCLRPKRVIAQCHLWGIDAAGKVRRAVEFLHKQVIRSLGVVQVDYRDRSR